MKFCWSTLTVKDMDETIKFYESVIGFKVNQRFPAGPDAEIAFLGDGETKIEFISYKGKTDINVGQDISWGFEVDSVDEMINILNEKEIKIIAGPIQPNPNAKFIFVHDPNGFKIQFFEHIK